jgi:hypothetical protein
MRLYVFLGGMSRLAWCQCPPADHGQPLQTKRMPWLVFVNPVPRTHVRYRSSCGRGKFRTFIPPHSHSLSSVVRAKPARMTITTFQAGKVDRWTAMTGLLVIYSRESDCLFNPRHGLWGKILRKGPKHSCVKLLAKDLDHRRLCACFCRVNDDAVFEDAVQGRPLGNPAQQAIIVFR